ncbi:MAG: hypothetical protein AW07_00321 [Candidatus Accumulibacter sp. SK-11]|nr:MAG: hypothetical protein AW07_00321 [Candidatus Accumulibacter sp. SK-11]
MLASTAGIASADVACTMIIRTDPGNGLPKTLRCAVVSGMSSVSSWSRPSRFCPFRARTPMMTKGLWRMRSVFPSGSSFGNRLSAAVWPISATRVAARTSESLKG